MVEREQQRTIELASVQAKAEELFHEIQARNLLRPGIKETHLNQEIYDLAKERFGISKYWHKRIVRAGPNTLAPYAENPPDRMIEDNDILFLDLGPVFEEWEADFGRTFVLGDDALKLKLRNDTEDAFFLGKEFFQRHVDLTASELYEHILKLALTFGWELGSKMAGHLIGQFPHEKIPNDKISLYIHPENHSILRSRSSDGMIRHWILEIHLWIENEKSVLSSSNC